MNTLKTAAILLALAAQAAALAAPDASTPAEPGAMAADQAATSPAMPARVKAEFAPHDPLVALTPFQSNRLKRKVDKLNRDGQFDKPDEALAFYANRRTGPLITRGSRVTVNRPLDTALYAPAIRQMRNMPRFDSARRAVLGAESSASLVSANVAAAPGAALGGWSSLGPANQGGRTRALLIDPATPTTLYAGGVAGGVWKSLDGGANWSTTTDLAMGNLAVVTLAFEPRNSSVLYAGTGEGVGNADGVRGNGVFKSVDAGLNWSQLASTTGVNFHYTMKVIVSPRKVSRLYAATRAGLFRSNDAGASWTNLLASASAVGGCTDMAIQEKRAIGYLYVSCGRTSGQGTVYRMIDSDTAAPVAVMSLVGQGRSSIAVAPSNESTVYVLSAQRTGGITGTGPGLGGLHGVYRSTDNGATFTTRRQGNVAFTNTQAKINQLLLSNPVIALLSECGLGTSSLSNQGWYDNVIAVDPVDASRVWVGGIDLWRSDNGGVDWGTAGYWWFDKGVDAQYHHADQHGLVFHPQYNGVTNKVLYSAHDGGVDMTADARAPVNTSLTQICGDPVGGSAAWVDRSNGYVTTQFYHGESYPDGARFLGGLQDNGTQRGDSANTSWTMINGGDGGYVALDTKGDVNPGNDVIFVENTGNSLRRSTNGGATFSNVPVGSPGITPSGFLFIAPFAMNPTNKNHLWAGGFDIWFTTNQANSYSRMTGANATCGQGSLSAVATHPLDGNRVLVGMSDGCFHYNHSALTPLAGTWPGGGVIASGLISSMAWDPNNLNVAYATVSNFGVTNLLKSTDGGISWVASVGAGATALPQIPAHSVVVNPADSSQLFVGTDLGVFTSIDGGASWYRENTGFANVVVEWLAINATAPRKLFAFTHGRGAWVTPLASSGAP